MLMMQKMYAMNVLRAVAPLAYHADGVTFNSYADSLSTLSLWGAGTPSSEGTLSFWFTLEPMGSSDAINIFKAFNPSGSATFYLTVSQSSGSTFFTFYIQSDDGASYYYIQYNTSDDLNTGWHHGILSWDVSGGAGLKTASLRVDDGSLSGFGDDGSTDGFSIDYANMLFTNFEVDDGFGVPMDLADVWFHPVETDLSVEANRREFIGADFKPVSLGVDGSTPTGSPPAVYLSGPVSGYLTNKGAGPDFAFTAINPYTDVTPDPWTGINAVTASEVIGLPTSQTLYGSSSGNLLVSFWLNKPEDTGEDFPSTFLIDAYGETEDWQIELGLYVYFDSSPSGPDTAKAVLTISVFNVNTSTLEYSAYISTDPVILTDEWVNLLFNVNSAGEIIQSYMNDTDIADTVFAPPPTMTIDWTIINQISVAEGPGSFSEVWIGPGQSLDISNVTNRRKFRTAGGAPENLGSDGSTPTTVAPAVYLKGDAAGYNVNSGTGPDFLSMNPQIEDAATSPND